jgi:extracellular factor (EF) 3-hydroxypalmitic acid methyl ester biosynthesis protein
LPTSPAAALTERLWHALAPGGLLIVGNFNGHNPIRHVIESLMDWYLIYRDPHELLALVDRLPSVATSEVLTDDTGCLHLLSARKVR